MLRYALTAAVALSMLSGAALAQDMGGKKVITRIGPNGVSKTIVHRHVTPYGSVVTHKRIEDGFSGGSVSHTRTFTNPVTGRTVTKTITHDR